MSKNENPNLNFNRLLTIFFQASTKRAQKQFPKITQFDP
jgi:hypothetical protein